MAIRENLTTETTKSQAMGDSYNYLSVVYEGGVAQGPEYFVMPQGGFVSSVKYSTRSVASDGTDYETITVNNERTTRTVTVEGSNLDAWSSTYTLGKSSYTFEANDVLSVASTASGAGIADGCVVVTVAFK